ncbi:insulin-like receptor [Copidosoma floridanum]|uniref:insulin-like receptor n=1 Tax=Copidosoma floridanum TaxID=29053 RepID=UPI0006C9B1DB|nr:insulin-like receptor [Copidosoma floridanum]XP_014208002.1 insulin-like receptor [Copidosoma floridanum]XP_014208003.1 insulin-like receptor [Copidosoma floridanum]XP_014208004.1 insulin-like receptor [Copidosoma floridanum]
MPADRESPQRATDGESIAMTSKPVDACGECRRSRCPDDNPGRRPKGEEQRHRCLDGGGVVRDNSRCFCGCCDGDRARQLQQRTFVHSGGSCGATRCRCGSGGGNKDDDNGERLGCAASVVRWRPGRGGGDGTTTARSRWWSFQRGIVVALLLLMLSLGPVSASFHKALNKAVTEDPPVTTKNITTRVCQSIDIRNRATEFDKLTGCRVVEGFIQILLIDEPNHAVFDKIIFPELVEITGYLLLFRVPGLRSIGQLFPNLAVIRGSHILYNYALVAFEMEDLQEIGLYSLTDIVRGSVRIDKNKRLCHADTIDWDMIAQAGKGENYIGTNKPSNECPVCDKSCPERPTKPDERLCWNQMKCQKICSKCGDRTCTPSGECCHESCLGGCNGDTAFNCTVCRDVMVNENYCVNKCPEGMYMYLSRRCVTAQQCRMIRKPREIVSDKRSNPYKPFNGKCEIDCPSGHEEVVIDDNYSCKKCSGRCFKECQGTVVDNMNSAQKLRGCTFINGSLEIAIRDATNVVKELEISLSQIEVIAGYLRIFRNFPLVSLNFLKSLTEIRGNHLDMKEYSLVVLNNPNLQELWDFTNRSRLNISARAGNEPKVLFHYNSKLCYQAIEQLREQTGLKPFSEIEVSTSSNGDRASCNITTLKSEVVNTTSKVALVIWEAFRHHDARKLLGYTIYLKDAPVQNVTLYESRDACGGDGWRVLDFISEDDTTPYMVPANALEDLSTNVNSTVYNTDKSNVTLKRFLTDLTPHTQYAYYVKTYMISGERSGAQSPIKYFRTLPGQPSPVRALAVYASKSDTLVIEWLPPTEPNSVLTHYKVSGVLDTYDMNLFKSRDYCEEPIRPEFKLPQDVAAEGKEKAQKELQASKEPESVPCSCAKAAPVQSENDVYTTIAFEDALHNQVYVKRNSRRRRDTFPTSFMLESVRAKRGINSLQEKDVISHNKKTDDLETKKRDRTDLLKKPAESGMNDNGKSFVFIVSANQTRLVIPNLRNYGKYHIAVSACRDANTNKLEKECSNQAVRSYQTLRKMLADDIPAGSLRLIKLFVNNSTPMIKLTWQEPPHPNGIIVSYNIEYKRVDVSGHKKDTLCITSEEFLKNGRTFTMPTSLAPGNYSVRVHATSLAGPGTPTPIHYFDIPDYSVSMPLWKFVLVLFLCTSMVVGTASGGLYYCNRKFLNGPNNNGSVKLIATVNPEYVTTYTADEWEVPRDKIEILKELGAGSFGMVYEGIARDLVKDKPETRCAIKTVNENASDRQKHEFLNEAAVMKGFQSHHVVRLLGVVSESKPTLVVMELMLYGDLKSYLRNHRPDEGHEEPPPSYERIMQMAIEVSDGMAYLASRKFVHRDLAARNIMVSEDLTVKIGDFGMTRDIYETDYYRKGTKGLLPVRWMPPESLKDGVFTSMSDVWSFGVVLYEMVTLASQPYQGLSNDQALKYVIGGGVMERPDNCPLYIYELMRQTWMYKPSERPTFIDLIEKLLEYINVEPFKEVSFYHSLEGTEAKNHNDLYKGNLSKMAMENHQRAVKRNQQMNMLETHSEAPEDAGESSPLRQDFNQDFSSSFDPLNNGKATTETSIAPLMESHYSMEPFDFHKTVSNSPRAPLGFLDLDSSKTPLKAGFDDFDVVSSAAASLASSKDTLNLPFVEDNVGSVKSSPYNRKESSSRGSVSQRSASRTSLSPQSPSIMVGPSSPGNRPSPSLVASSRSDLESDNRSPNYENHSPELVQGSSQFHGSRTSLRVGGSNSGSSFPSMDTLNSIDLASSRRRGTSSSPLASITTPTPLLTVNMDSLSVIQQRDGKQQELEQPVVPTSLNNGYISGGPAT